MAENRNDQREDAKTPRPVPAVSGVLPDGALFEMVYRPGDSRSGFVVWDRGEWRLESTLNASPSRRLVPYSPHNNLLRNRVVLFPSGPEEYGSEIGRASCRE